MHILSIKTSPKVFWEVKDESEHTDAIDLLAPCKSSCRLCFTTIKNSNMTSPGEIAATVVSLFDGC